MLFRSPQEVDYDVTVPDGSVWVLGDNRDNSQDSRYQQDQPGDGFVPINNIVGRAFLITWPLSRFGLLDFHPEVFAGIPDPDDAASDRSGTSTPSPAGEAPGS